jgi:DNA/RNA-binding domain of Phe-tRNA-synthetase-like protein
MTTYEILREIIKQNSKLADEITKFRDQHEVGSENYAFRDGQLTSIVSQKMWAKDMLGIYYPA